MHKLIPFVCISILLGCAQQTVSERPNVILICLDTVRADRMGFLGYRRNPTTPRLDDLAAESIVFTDVGSTAGWTKPSVPSFLTGTYPMQHGVYEGSARAVAGKVTDVLGEEALTLAEVFREQGYDTAAFIRNAQLKRGNGFEQGFDCYEVGAGDAREIRWRAMDWVDEHEGGPFFLYLHFLDAHWPFPVPEEYARMFARSDAVDRFRGQSSRDLRDAINDGTVVLTTEEVEAMRAVYDGSIRYIDDQLGRFFAGLEQRGLWENTVVCVVADHGEEFLEHGRIGHGHGLYENLVRVPWFLRVPGAAAERRDEAVSLVDLFPTLLSAAGLVADAPVAGVDRLEYLGATGPILSEHKGPGSYEQSLRAGRWKLVREFRAANPVASSPSLDVGQRVEVEIHETTQGTWRAREIGSLADPADDPIEIKGRIDGLDDAGFGLNGVRIRFAQDCDLYGQVPEGMSAGELPQGQPVKAIGFFRGDDFVCQRVKLYDKDADIKLEVRGTIRALGAERLQIGPQWIEYDERTDLDLVASDEEQRMTREDVFRILESGQSASEAGFSVRTTLFDLLADPGEAAAASAGEVEVRLTQQLDALARELSLSRTSAARAVLDEAALEDLRRIGYVR